MKHIVASAVIALTLLLAASCEHQRPPASSSAKTDSVTAIVLPRYQATLPPGPGREAFAVACLSCHSTRYITMQPKMSAAKWEESVRKMMKTYAAPIAEEQVQPIVQYLMVAKEGGDGSSWETPAVVVTPKMDELLPTSNHTDAAHGAAVYAQSCASCHSNDGRGNTPAAITMLPRPTDLTSGRYANDAWVVSAVVRGVPGTAMPAMPNLSDQDVRNVAAYVRKFEPESEAPPSPTETAAALFAKNCSSCHGVKGVGDGVAAPPLARVPANFHQRQPTRDQAARVIAEGVPGTAMAAWRSKLSDAQRAMLAEYVRTFYDAPR